MTLGSKLMLYTLVAGPAVLVLVYLVLLGPVGWFAAAFLALGAMAYLAKREDDSDRPSPTNCPECGSPNPAEAQACGYCGDPL